MIYKIIAAIKAILRYTLYIPKLHQILLKYAQPYVTSKSSHNLFEALHSLLYPGVRATQHLITACVYLWENKNIFRFCELLIGANKYKGHLN